MHSVALSLSLLPLDTPPIGSPSCSQGTVSVPWTTAPALVTIAATILAFALVLLVIAARRARSAAVLADQAPTIEGPGRG